MSLSVEVKHVRSHSAFNLDLDLGEEGASLSEEQRQDTSAALFGYLKEKARSDRDLSVADAETLQFTPYDVEGQGTAEHRPGHLKTAELVGMRIRDLGDEIMEQFSRDPTVDYVVQGCIEDDDGRPSTAVAYEHFRQVVSNVFECDENGVARKINLGRIASVFGYCYYLCKTFIQRNITNGILGFLNRLVGYLIRAFLSTHFYEWLKRQGGWAHLLALTDRVVPGLHVSVGTVLVVGAVLLLSVWAVRRLALRS